MNRRTLVSYRGPGTYDGCFCAGSGARTRQFGRPGWSEWRYGITTGAGASQLDRHAERHDFREHDDSNNGTREKSLDRRGYAQRPQERRDFDFFKRRQQAGERQARRKYEG